MFRLKRFSVRIPNHFLILLIKLFVTEVNVHARTTGHQKASERD
ncbi:hypothetical protein STFR1_20690 [Bacillus vallismortis]